jgi:signal transduction histidine kinase
MIMQLEVTSAQVHRKNYQQAQEVLSQALADARTTLRDAQHAITDLRCRTPRVDQLISSVQQEIQMQPKTLESGRKYKSWA